VSLPGTHAALGPFIDIVCSETRHDTLIRIHSITFPKYETVKSPQIEESQIEGGRAEPVECFPLARFSTTFSADAPILHVEGEIDLSNASLLKDTVSDVYERNQRVMVDPSRLRYLDATGG
jgi:hypothetical protein